MSYTHPDGDHTYHYHTGNPSEETASIPNPYGNNSIYTGPYSAAYPQTQETSWSQTAQGAGGYYGTSPQATHTYSSGFYGATQSSYTSNDTSGISQGTLGYSSYGNLNSQRQDLAGLAFLYPKPDDGGFANLDDRESSGPRPNSQPHSISIYAISSGMAQPVHLLNPNTERVRQYQWFALQEDWFSTEHFELYKANMSVSNAFPKSRPHGYIPPN